VYIAADAGIRDGFIHSLGELRREGQLSRVEQAKMASRQEKGGNNRVKRVGIK